MRFCLKMGAAVLLAWSTGCVPLSQHKKLEERFEQQETYVAQHKDKVRELERREQVMTLRAKEQERQLELLRTRLEKSERLRTRLQDELKEAAAVPASAPRQEAPVQVMGLEVNPNSGGLVLENSLLFPAGQAELKAGGRQVLDRLVAELNAPEYAGRHVRIDGHTDDAPINHSKDRHKSNWELSSKRALAVLHYLESKGFDPDRLSFAGFGPHQPIASGSDAKARARNRRVEIVLIEAP